jgi:hypothetical protein
MPATQRLDLAITLELRNQDELTALLNDLYNPASPNYRHYLSAEEFTERFAPTPEDHAKVLAFARANGLVVTHTAPNRLVVDVNGAVEDIERGFGVKMQVYRHPTEARTFYAPDTEPSVDASLPIQGISGLSDLYPLRRVSSPQSIAGKLTPQSAGGSGPNGTYWGSDLRSAYALGVSLDGTGQTIALFEGGPYKLSDIQAYFAAEGQTLNVPIVNVLLDGMNGVCGFECDDTEEALDIDMALALAPNLSAVLVYEGDFANDILNQIAADNLAQQVSISYVWTPDPTTYDPIFKELSAQGQSVLVSSGDGGAYSAPGCTPSSNCWTSRFPAEDPYVTAVGGTELTTSGAGGAWQSETSWAMSGGGISSDALPIASYQAPLINGSNQGSSTLRNIPDVAAIASNVFLVSNGAQGSGGGTSAATPVWASFLALANQQANGSPIGFLNPSIYTLAQTANFSSYFHDITTGNNFNSYSPDLFSAVAGYDLVTGLGSPNGQALIDALAQASSGANFSLHSSSTTINVSQGDQGTTQITLQAVNGFSGTVNLRVTVIGQPTGVSVGLSQPSIGGVQSSILTLSTTTGVSVPNVMLCITGTNGGLTQSVYIPVAIALPNLVETAVSAPPATVVPSGTFSVADTTKNNGQAPATVSSVTQYYLSDSPSKSGIYFPIGSRPVAPLTAGASSSGSATLTVPPGIWPNTPYYVIACANDTGAVAQATSDNCAASASTTIFIPSTTATTTSLAVTSSGAPVQSVTAGSAVTLTATVTAGAIPTHPGQVNFCDATAAYCTDSHLLETAQLKTNGTATIKFIPAIGAHSYRAVFVGTTVYAASASSASALAVTGTHPTTTSIALSGNEGDYSLTATVAGTSGIVAPSGTVSFLDASQNNASLGSATLVAGAPSLGWMNSATPTVGNDPQGVATGDFNGDGIPDIAVANRNDNSVTILLGNGDGTFTQASTVPNIYSAQAMAVADFNGDGIADLAVVNTDWGGVTILIGNGNGTFTNTNSLLSSGVLPLSVATGDFNGDGIQDVAVANAYSNTVSIFLGNGDGTFAAGPVIETNGAPQSLAAGDFNGDGRLDLAVAAANPNNEFVQIMLGNGDGSFTPLNSTLPVGVYPTGIVAADFNGDGKTDLAVTIAETNSVAVFLGNGDGTFTAAGASPATGGYPLSLVTADVNGDGRPDLVVANDGGSTLTILLGNGDGTFTAVENSVTTGNSPTAIAVADFNGDGIPDFATVNELDNSISVLLTQLTQSATAELHNVSPTGGGSHSAEAGYLGDTNYGSSVSTAVALSALTTPVVTVNPSSSSITTLQALQATVTVAGTPTPTGTVTLTSGGYSSAATALSSGSAAFTIPAGSLAAGSDTLSANYTPDSNSAATYSSASGVSGTVTVSKTMPTVIVMPGSSSITTLQALQVTVTVPGTPTPTGTVTLTGGSYSSAATGLSSGSVAFTIPAGSLAVGGDTLTANYAPDSNSSATYTGASGVSGSVTVSKATPTVTVSPSSSSITTLQSLLVTVTVLGTPTPTGTITLTSGSYTSAATALSSGSAAITIPAGSLAVGNDTLTANYTPDTSSSATYASASGVSAPVAVSKVAATLTVTPASTSITTLQLLQVTVTVTGGASGPTPIGTITLTSGSYSSAVTALSSGSAVITIPAGSLAVGSDTLTADYTPDSNSSVTYTNASGVSGTVTVSKVAPTVTVTPGLSSITTLQSLQVTVAVSGTPTPTGTITLTGGSYSSGATGLSSGSAMITIPTGSLVAGNDTLTADYTPDSNSSATYTSASGVSGTVTVSKVAPTVTVTPGSSSITTLQSLQVTVAVSGTPIPTGTITLTSGSYSSAATALSSGSAMITIPAGSLAAGSDTLTADYTPDTASSATYASTSGASGPVMVALANSAPVLASISPAYIGAGDTAFTLTVTGTGFISGSTVYWGSTPLTTQFASATELTAQVSAAQVAAAGQSAISVESPAPGGGTSNSLEFEIDSAGSGGSTAPVFPTSSVSVSAGATASYPVTLPSSATNVSVECLNLPQGATCSYSSSTGAVSITTTSETAKGTYQVTVVFTETLLGAASAFVIPLFILPLALRRNRSQRGIWLITCVALVAFTGAALLSGCGGGNTLRQSGGNQTHQVTSSGVVTLTIK